MASCSRYKQDGVDVKANGVWLSARFAMNLKRYKKHPKISLTGFRASSTLCPSRHLLATYANSVAVAESRVSAYGCVPQPRGSRVESNFPESALFPSAAD